MPDKITISDFCDEFGDNDYALLAKRENHEEYTTISVIKRNSDFYKRMNWLHHGANLVCVRGSKVANVKAYLDANEFVFGLMKVALVSQPGSRLVTMLIGFNNHLSHSHQNENVNAAFDQLVAHFSSKDYREFYYEVFNKNEYKYS